jgi:parallel beta-helix repeat protein
MTEIDRGESGSRGRKEKKLPRIMMATLIVATILAASLSLLPAPSSDVPPTPGPAGISYASHTNISIIGDAGFLKPNASTGITWGSGTASDPYIIEGWEIDLGFSFGIMFGISIQNARVHFVIRDCYVHDGRDVMLPPNAIGINLDNIRNGTIDNNTLSNNEYDIALGTSKDNIISNNTCSLSGDAIYLSQSSGNTIGDNNCSDGGANGIYLSQSSGNTINNNTCSSNSWLGMFFESSNSNTIAWNDVCNNTKEGIYIMSGSLNRIWNNTFINNNGTGSIYNANRIQVHDDGTNNRWNTSGTPHGYGNSWSDWRAPDDNWDWIVDNPYDISGSAGAKDRYPLTVSKCALHGTIFIDGNIEFNNTLYPSNGVVSGNGTASNPYIIEGWAIAALTANGIVIQNTDAHFIVRDCVVWDDVTDYWDIVLSNCTNGVLSGNNCTNSPYGIHLSSSSNSNTLVNNSCSNNNVGIYLGSSDNNTLTDNDCDSNAQSGTYLDSSDNNTLTHNNCSANGIGIYLVSSNNNTLVDNNCSGNNGGIYLSSSSDNALVNNTCSNGTTGMYLSSSNNNTIGNNACSGNSKGMYVIFSDGNIISNNTCNLNSQYGIHFAAPSDSNTISVNLLCNNTIYGIYLQSGSANSIWNNTFVGNNGAGVLYDAGHVQAYDAGSNNRWNSSSGFGNYWSDLTTPDVLPPFGIVDWSYNLTGSAGAKDYYPLTTPGTPIPEFSEVVIPIAGLMLILLIFGRARKKL